MGNNASQELQKFLDDIDEKVLECTICLGRYTNPKILNCFHSYCLSCLEDWVKKNKGKLTCPTCTTSHPIPEDGLQKLPPNTFLNNLLDTIRQYSKSDKIKCFCGKEDKAKDYCQECRHYLCTACSDYHKKLPMSADHKLHSVEEVKQMSPIKFASLHPPLCLHHNKLLEFYCEECKAATCVNCTISGHPVCNGSKKQIDISDAFKTFKETSEKLIKSAEQCKVKLQGQRNTVLEDAKILEESKSRSLKDIDKHVTELVKNITENGDKLKSEVEKIFKEKKNAIDVQTDEMAKVISDIDKRASLLNHCLKMDGARAIESSGTVVTSLNDSINQLRVTENDDNVQHNQEIYFIKNKDITSMQQCDIGTVSHK